MKCTAVRCAVQAIAEKIGDLPVITYSEAPDGTRERASDHPAQAILDQAANDFTPSSDMREQLTRDAILHGDGCAFISRNNDGVPIELFRFLPDTVTIEAAPGTFEPLYRVNGEIIPRSNILHIRAPNFNPGQHGFKGESIISQEREAIGLALTLEQHAARLFGNGARPSGLLSFKTALTGDARTRAKAAWDSAHSGANSGKTAVIDADANWQALTLNSTDAQFLELRKFQIEEVARAFRVPPVLLMEYGRATWGNSEEMGRQFLQYTLMPWIKRWEGEISLKLFSPEERSTYYAEFSTDDLLRADLAASMQAYSIAVASRILNPNEVRQLFNRPPYKGGDEFVNPNTTATPITGAPSNV